MQLASDENCTKAQSTLPVDPSIAPDTHRHETEKKHTDQTGWTSVTLNSCDNAASFFMCNTCESRSVTSRLILFKCLLTNWIKDWKEKGEFSRCILPFDVYMPRERNGEVPLTPFTTLSLSGAWSNKVSKASRSAKHKNRMETALAVSCTCPPEAEILICPVPNMGVISQNSRCQRTSQFHFLCSWTFGTYFEEGKFYLWRGHQNIVRSYWWWLGLKNWKLLGNAWNNKNLFFSIWWSVWKQKRRFPSNLPKRPPTSLEEKTQHNHNYFIKAENVLLFDATHFLPHSIVQLNQVFGCGKHGTE